MEPVFCNGALRTREERRLYWGDVHWLPPLRRSRTDCELRSVLVVKVSFSSFAGPDRCHFISGMSVFALAIAQGTDHLGKPLGQTRNRPKKGWNTLDLEKREKKAKLLVLWRSQPNPPQEWRHRLRMGTPVAGTSVIGQCRYRICENIGLAANPRGECRHAQSSARGGVGETLQTWQPFGDCEHGNGREMTSSLLRWL
jgi:hypothetical protein